MNKETLDSLKEPLTLDSAIDIGRFGIFYDSSESGEDNYYITANKEGLKMFVYQLLCASKDLQDHLLFSKEVSRKIRISDLSTNI